MANLSFIQNNPDAIRMIPQQEDIVYKFMKKNTKKLVSQFMHGNFYSKSYSPEKDMKEATDLTIGIENNKSEIHFALRIRWTINGRQIKWSDRKDITIRSKHDNGSDAELIKIRNGYGHYMLYCWGNQNLFVVDNWIMIDLDIFRKYERPISDKKPDKSNYDGTYFKSYSLKWLKKINCIIDGNINLDDLNLLSNS